MYRHVVVIQHWHLKKIPERGLGYWERPSDAEVLQSAQALQDAVKQRILYHVNRDVSLRRRNTTDIIDYLMKKFDGIRISHILWDMWWGWFYDRKAGKLSYEPRQYEINRAVTNTAIDIVWINFAKRVKEIVSLYDPWCSFVKSCQMIVMRFCWQYRISVTPEDITKILDEARGDYDAAAPFKTFLREFLKKWRGNYFRRDWDAMSAAIRDTTGRISDYVAYKSWRDSRVNKEHYTPTVSNLSDSALAILLQIEDSLTNEDAWLLGAFLSDTENPPRWIDELLDKIKKTKSVALSRRQLWKKMANSH